MATPVFVMNYEKHCCVIFASWEHEHSSSRTLSGLVAIRNGSGFPHASDLTLRRSHTEKEGYKKLLRDEVRARQNLSYLLLKFSLPTPSLNGLSGLSHVLRVGRFPSHLEVDVWRSSASSDVGGRKGRTVIVELAS